MNLNSNLSVLPELKIYLTLIPGKNRELFLCYVEFIRQLSLKALKEHSTPQKLNLLHKAVSRQWNDNFLLGKLQSLFIKENLSLSLLFEPIEGYMWGLKNHYELDYVKSAPLLLQIISPISRLMVVLNNEKPLLYIPFSNLIFAYFSLYLRNCPNVIKLLKNNKIVFDVDLMDEYMLSHFTEILSIFSIKMNLLLRLKLCVFIGLYKLLISKKVKKLNFLCYVNAFLYGLYYSFTEERKNKNQSYI